MSIEDEQARFMRCIGEPTRLQILKLLARQQTQNIYYKLTDTRLARLILDSESLMKELSLCQSEGECYDERTDQECCNS